jgi:polyisoprenoid-binding protein YceI
MKYLFILMALLITDFEGFTQTVDEGLEGVARPKSFRVDSGSSRFTIKGTSSLHDWEMVSENCSGSLLVDVNSDKLTIQDIKVSVVVKTLKSGKRIMDNKCYDALKYEKFPTIKYQFEKLSSLSNTGSGMYKATLHGTLNIAGSSKKVAIHVNITQTDKTITIKGELPLKMTDFGVEPPTALLGTIKTGDAITIDFNLNYN